MRFAVGLLLSCLAITSFAQERRVVRFGILSDGPSPRFEREYLGLLKQEITTLLTRDFEVVFDESVSRVAGYDLTKISANLDELLAREDVDVVLCMGVLATMEAASRGPFAKPVIAPFGIDPTLPIYPRTGDSSGIKNFNYMVTPGSVTRDIQMIAKMKPMKRVHLVVMRLFAEKIPAIKGYAETIFASVGLQVTMVLSNDTAQEVLDNLGDDVEMVYVTPQIRMSDEEKVKFFEGLAERRIPSFSMLGREEVELGAMAGLAPASDTLRWFRRIALNVQRTLLGEDPGTLPVLLKQNSKLTFNMRTARMVGWYPPWNLQISADLINEERDDVKRVVSLEQAINRALEVNPDLAAIALELEQARVQVELAKAPRRPSLTSSVTGVAVDDDTSAASFGSQGTTEVSGELKFTQLLYGEQAFAALDLQNLALLAKDAEYQTARLDMAKLVSDRFLNFLKARTLYSLRSKNLDLTESHLQTARTRREVGIAGSSEVFRWEAQVATDKLEAITAKNIADQSLYALNLLLDEPQEYMLRATIPDMVDSGMRTGSGRIQKHVSNAYDFERFRYFMAEEALRDAPELKRIDALIALQKRKLVSDKRAYFLPQVALEGRLNHQFHMADTDNPLAALLPPGGGANIPTQPDTGWSMALNFSLPLYSGGQRKQNLRLDSYGLERLELVRHSVSQQLELRVRAGLQELATATVAINLRHDAAVAAAKNLELLEDAYSKGVASLIDLLDAQNAALVSQLAAGNAQYDYFLALMGFQRASGNFDFFISVPEREAFFQRLETFYQKYQ